MRVGSLRLRRVRFKDGRTVEVLPGPSRAHDETMVRQAVNSILRSHTGSIAGCAVVVWGADNTSTAVMRVTAASKIPSIVVPDFVRARLLAERIEQWTIDDLKDAGLI